ncbi:MAG TPA: cupredoxin domain-containing protein [Dehalococcoidia bacterium]|nr:cupredoxin domain-containing protein [Dehalococcoidia bacterium]
MALIAAVATAMACGGSSGSEGGSGAPSTGPASEARTAVQINAAALKFDTKTIVLPAKSDVTVSLRNEDAGVLHNLAIYKKADGTGKVFAGELFNGIETREYRFKTPEPGTYYFRCDAHPEMSGTVKVQ